MGQRTRGQGQGIAIVAGRGLVSVVLHGTPLG